MTKRRGEKASRPDEENPEWTAQDFARARPALDVIGEVFGAKSAQALRRLPGRPSKLDRNHTLRESTPVANVENATIYSASPSRIVKGMGAMSDEDNGQLFVERRAQGDYAVRRPGSERASDVLPTQKAAIARARELSPSATPMVERVRNTSAGKPDKWRKP